MFQLFQVVVPVRAIGQVWVRQRHSTMVVA